MTSAGRRGWRLLDPILLFVVLVLYLVAVRTRAGQWVDDLAFEGRKSLHHPSRQLVGRVVDLTTGPIVVGLLAVVVVEWLRRRRPLVAVAAVLSVGVAVGTARLLKEWLPRPQLLDFTWAGPGNTLPSGHVAASTAVVVLALASVPVAMRRAAVRVGAVAVGAHAVGVLVAGWHRPSDVLASLMIGAAASGPFCELRAARRDPLGEPASGRAVAELVPTRQEVVLAVSVLVALLVGSNLLPPSTSHSFSAFLLAAVLAASTGGALAVGAAVRSHA